MNIDGIKEIIEACKRKKHTVTVKDVCFVLLNKEFDDARIAYKVIFGEEEGANEYVNSAPISYLETVLREKKLESNRNDDSLSFEDNREAMIKLLEEIEQAQRDGTIEDKDAIKMKSDIRTRLNDKFGTTERQEEQRIIVEPKFNTICPHTRKECWTQTKEYAMKHWNLIEKK